MATDLYPNKNGIVSTVIEEQVQQQTTPPSPNIVLIFGTAKKGDLLKPTRLDASTIADTFGAVPNDPYYDYSLVKGFYEIKNTDPTVEVYGVRVGNATKAKLDLYEMSGLGEYSPSNPGYDTLSLSIEAVTEGLEGNNIKVSVLGDESGYPTKMEIDNLNTNTTVSFDLSIDGSVPNAYSTCTALANAINANTDLNTYIKATANALEDSSGIVITDDGSGNIDTEYNINAGNPSGNKIAAITSVNKQTNFSDDTTIHAGDSTAVLQYSPDKVMDNTVDTFTDVYSIVTNDILVGPATPPDVVVGESGAFTLGNSFGGLSSKGFNSSASMPIDGLKVYRKSGSTGLASELTLGTTGSLVSGEYSYDSSTKQITVFDINLGDLVYATYKFATSYVESKNRSELIVGDRLNYFVAGDMVVFGAAQEFSLDVHYSTNQEYKIPSDVRIIDQANGIIKFVNPMNYPNTNDVVNVTYIYEPELPAKTGTTLVSGNIQGSQLYGGSDGHVMSKAEYYNALAKGYIAADNIPCRIAIPQGVYIDDVISGIDQETGMPSELNAGFQTQLSNFVKRKSQYVSECIGIIGTRPISTTNPASPLSEEKEAWYDKLVNVSATDTTRAANVVSSVDDYHLRIPTGDLYAVLPEVLNGLPYLAAANNLLGTMIYAQDNLSSLINKTPAAPFVKGVVYPIMASDRINSINGMRYTLFTTHAQDGRIIIADAPTLAKTTSQFTRQYTVDIMFEAINAVRFALDGFIGKPNKPSTRQTMEATAKLQLQEMSPDKIISFDVKIDSVGTSVSGKTRVFLTLTTAVEIRKIEIVTRLKLGV